MNDPCTGTAGINTNVDEANNSSIGTKAAKSSNGNGNSKIRCL